MTESFVHLGIGNRHKTYLGIQKDIPVAEFGPNYVSLLTKIAGIIKNGKASRDTKVSKGEYVQLVAELEIRPSKCRALIVPNQELIKFGLVTCQTIKEADDKPGITVGFLCQEDIDVATLPWLVRIYALV
jgi:hypothetical protein